MDAEALRQPVSGNEASLVKPHPITAVLLGLSPQIVDLNTALAGMPYGSESQAFAKGSLGFLADAVEGIGAFELEQGALEEIWETASHLDVRFGYDLARIVGASFAIQGVQDFDRWRGFPRVFLESNRFPEHVQRDRDGISHVRDRAHVLHGIVGNLVGIFGRREIGAEVMGLNFRIEDGDPNAQQELDELLAIINHAEKQRALHGVIRENLTNGFFLPMGFELHRTLEVNGSD